MSGRMSHAFEALPTAFERRIHALPGREAAVVNGVMWELHGLIVGRITIRLCRGAYARCEKISFAAVRKRYCRTPQKHWPQLSSAGMSSCSSGLSQTYLLA